jgi:hypothetical protein
MSKLYALIALVGYVQGQEQVGFEAYKFLSDSHPTHQLQGEEVWERPGASLPKVNNRPIIGVLSQPFDPNFPAYEGYNSYIMKNYITYLESSGARAVPIIYSTDEKEVEAQLAKLPYLNGVFYCGGNAKTGEGDYYTFGK